MTIVDAQKSNEAPGDAWGPTMANPELDQRSIETIRFLAVDMVENADSGHPGLPMGAAAFAYVLWTRFLRYDPDDPAWPDRDRFVLSAGHGSALLYCLLHLTGYDLPMEQLRRFRQWESRTPGHPESTHTPGVEVTTGPLGQGFGNAVGLAIAERHLAARFNRPDHAVVDHRTFVLASDGDLMEGVGSEAASLAGHLGLGNLICLYDDNRISLAAGTDITFTEDRAKRFEAYGWHVQVVENGNDLDAVEAAIRAAVEESERPSFIAFRTHIGYGSPNKQDTFKAHGSPLGADEVKATKVAAGWPLEPTFLVPDEVAAHFLEARPRGAALKRAWQERMDAYAEAEPQLAADLRSALAGELPTAWTDELPTFEPDPKGMATRKASGKVMNAIARSLPNLVGGSADLDPSTYTALDGMGDFQAPGPASRNQQGSAGGGWSHAGRNVHFGVREHAMGAIANGMAAHGGLLPFTATFLIFSDYMRPPMRLAALSHHHVVYVFTHDSVGLGEDGPTHQPIEQLANLRAVPGLSVIRPADANEVSVAWRVAIEAQQGPTALVFTRQAVPTLDRSELGAADGLRKGAYVLAGPADGARPELVLIASGSEVALIEGARAKLESDGVKVQSVSMPSWDLFEAQPASYRETVLPPAVPARLAVEAGATQGWHKYVGDEGAVLGIDHFGASAPGEEVMEAFGFTVENVVAKAKELLAARAGRS